MTAHKADRKVGTCGKAPSYYLDFAAFLVAGIDSMSLNPDSVVSVKQGVCSEPLCNLRGSLQFLSDTLTRVINRIQYDRPVIESFTQAPWIQ